MPAQPPASRAMFLAHRTEGGYRLIPETIEFWQGREDRLHDRIRYQRARNGRWQVERLAP